MFFFRWGLSGDQDFSRLSLSLVRLGARSLSFGDGGGGVGLVAVATVVSRLWSSSSSKNFTGVFYYFVFIST